MRLGAVHAFVVHGHDGMDELTLTTTTKICETKNGAVNNWTFDPREHGFSLCDPKEIKGGGPEENAEITLRILKGEERGPKRDIVLINSAFAIMAGDLATDFKSALKIAENSITSGEATRRLETMRKITSV
jgi:anthranilate phosphoribosyltransferase